MKATYQRGSLASSLEKEIKKAEEIKKEKKKQARGKRWQDELPH